jgi:hypothetical protein
MFGRQSIRNTAQALLAALLFAHGALAADICTMPERSPARALAVPDSMPCHQAEQDELNKNLCLADCLSFDQNAGTPPLPVLAPPPAPVLVLVLVDQAAVNVAAAQSALPHPPAPPPRILFQSFQI